MDDNYDDGKYDDREGTGTNVHNSKNNVLPLWGNERSMNLNPLILTNIQSSHYFKVNLYELKTYHEVIDEIYFKVNHLEPWEKGSRKTAGQTGMCGGVRGVGAGGIVSTAFCLLYKLFTLKLTRKQVIGLITHPDSPYIRGLGFMYIRYTQPPADLWDWYEPYLDDPEELDVRAGGGQIMTIGNILKNFLCKLEWFSTLFPRIPVPIQQKLERKMNERYPPSVQAARQPGSRPGLSSEPERYSGGRNKVTESKESRNRDDHYSNPRSSSRERYRDDRGRRDRSSSVKNGNRSPSRENRDSHRERERDRYRDEERRRRQDKEREYERSRSKYDDSYDDKYRREEKSGPAGDDHRDSRKHKDEYIRDKNHRRSDSPERHRMTEANTDREMKNLEKGEMVLNVLILDISYMEFSFLVSAPKSTLQH
ncbi:hypothetical protein V9T40_001112 [Parthenolecanium corni]|uniref:Pre-mRNA-splicing factor 38 n=1 Tax=Parthenolecanium corni TaxID=536013 RepID=A0AAN9Y2D2_9HEMI